MREQTGYVLETEAVAGVFLADAEDNNGYNIGSSSVFKTLVTVAYNLLSPRVFSMVESRVLQIYKMI